MPYRAHPPAQLVPYDPRQEGLYMVAGKGDGSPRKVVAYYRDGRDPRSNRYHGGMRGDISSESSWWSSSNWSENSDSTAKSMGGLFYNALANIRDRFYDNLYLSPQSRRYRYTRRAPSTRSYSDSSEEYWNRSGSESSSSSIPSCYTCSSASESSLPDRYRVQPEFMYPVRYREHRHHPRPRYVRERGFWERILGW
ncbi:hypothetical protein I204_01977 [Kwoniella mangroviensis CBS 8886]|uniref:uncharacterized protein n=1 Tax=Kwoniella mangroviensis CBS 8507 TaxID=1296122 RepID=UPI00080D10A1|nr:uncharacterized protein I203_03717 [Kwoniella mangroviensis CBS 8507]OCF67034.1 hypothetical protein I203_03717 [Kwoniella mangroviensis CBS 8507]OCF77972.1 hypothetical protein I204_01977 [Kwoniella mangroviensis CBS 8886]